MKPLFVFIVGAPASGKTTLARKLIGQVVFMTDKPKWTIGKAAIAAGHYIGSPFDGADQLPYNGALKAIEFLKENIFSDYSVKQRIIILDGDRTSNSVCKVQCEKMGNVSCILLACDDEEILRRSKSRAKAIGAKEQNETWAKGRKTKSENFFNTFESKIKILASATPEEILLISNDFISNQKKD